ncbi:MAG TPA: hypothetical protein VHX40_02285 [Acidimicrobiales bacterium]|nr:hypothetical protein [Acidimicrobiales bacterium]
MGPVANHPLRGRGLRRAVMAVLLRAGRPLTIGEILVAVEHGGRTVDGGYPRKRLADALGYEARRGWVVRVERGTYAVGRVSRTSKWRLLNRPD